MRTFQKLFACILLEEGLVRDWARQVVDHQLQDGLDLVLSVTGIVSQGNILECVSVSDNQNDNMGHTHSPRSSTNRAKYMAAAATWLGGYARNRWSRQPISKRYLPRVRV